MKGNWKKLEITLISDVRIQQLIDDNKKTLVQIRGRYLENSYSLPIEKDVATRLKMEPVANTWAMKVCPTAMPGHYLASQSGQPGKCNGAKG